MIHRRDSIVPMDKQKAIDQKSIGRLKRRFHVLHSEIIILRIIYLIKDLKHAYRLNRYAV